MQDHVTSGSTAVMFLADAGYTNLQHMHAAEDSHLLCPSHSYPFGDEVSAHHQVILGNPSVAWENWKKPAPREGYTKTVIQQHYTLILSPSLILRRM